MTAPSHALVLEKLADLRGELADLAFVLERRGQMEAADVAIVASARVEELCEELSPSPTASSAISVRPIPARENPPNQPTKKIP